jgi:fermentation-respiration switch protein FrsA (DUF1100 family)
MPAITAPSARDKRPSEKHRMDVPFGGSVFSGVRGDRRVSRADPYPPTDSRPTATPLAVPAPLLRRLVERPEVWEPLQQAFADLEDADPLDEARWGSAPSASAHLSAVLRAATEAAQIRKAVQDDALSVEEAAARLDADVEEVRSRVAERSLVAIDGDLLPAWQFDEGQPARALPGLAELQGAFPGSAYALTSWVLAPNEALAGASPRDRLAGGEVPVVVALAEAVGA